MITVVGEALIDLVLMDGHVAAQPGGGPFNVARTIGRLGLAPAFLGRLSRDGFGRMLRARLDEDGVAMGLPALTDAPTTLAAVDVDPDGVPQYHFYLDGTSSAALEYPLALPADLTALPAGHHRPAGIPGPARPHPAPDRRLEGQHGRSRLPLPRRAAPGRRRRSARA